MKCFPLAACDPSAVQLLQITPLWTRLPKCPIGAVLQHALPHSTRPAPVGPGTHETVFHDHFVQFQDLKTRHVICTCWRLKHNTQAEFKERLLSFSPHVFLHRRRFLHSGEPQRT